MEVAVSDKYPLSGEGSSFAAFLFLRARISSLRLCFPPRPGLCHIGLGKMRAARPSVRSTARRSDQFVDLCEAADLMMMVRRPHAKLQAGRRSVAAVLFVGKLSMLGVRIRFRNDDGARC